MTGKTREASRSGPGELGLIVSSGAVLIVYYAAMGITKIISVSGLISQVKDQYSLLVWAGIASKRHHKADPLGPRPATK